MKTTRIVERLLGKQAPAPAVEQGTAIVPAAPSATDAATRRQRALSSAEEIVAEALGAKVLQAWLSNRHQTLHPLTVNLRPLAEAQLGLLAQVTAVALLAASGPATPGRVAAAQAWFRSAGSGEPAIAALLAALEAPPSLSAVMAGIQDADLSALAYVAVLSSADRQDPATRLFIAYLAARLGLPDSVVRSANRRYGRAPAV